MKAVSRILKIVGVLYMVIAVLNEMGAFGEFITPHGLINAVTGSLYALLLGFSAIALGILLDRTPSRG